MCVSWSADAQADKDKVGFDAHALVDLFSQLAEEDTSSEYEVDSGKAGVDHDDLATYSSYSLLDRLGIVLARWLVR